MTEEQGHMFRVLRVFKSLCEERGLTYYLMGGSLIGAVRHQGFIPWDDDIDVSMPLEDFLRVQELEELLPEGIEFHSERTDPEYPVIFIRLCDITCPLETKNERKPKGAYIDIFPLMHSKPLNRGTGLAFSVVNVINYVLQVKLRWLPFVPYKQRVARIGFSALRVLPCRWLRALRKWLIARLYDRDGQTTICSPGGAYKADKEFFPARWFMTWETVTFEGETFPAPVGWDSYLRRNYGDYMELPPEEERIPRHG